MDELEEIFLKKWGMKLEDIQMLLKRLEHVKQTENDIVMDFEVRFDVFLYQIPRSHHPGDKYLIYIYTNEILVHLGFLLNKKGKKTIYDASYMARQIEENIFLSKVKHIFSLGTKVDDPKGTPNTLSLERLVTLETFNANFQREGEQIIDQQNAKGKDLDEVFQSHREEQRTTEDTVKELEPEKDDEVLICTPPFVKSIHEHFPPTQEEENEVSHFPFQDPDNALFYDSKKEEKMESSGKLDLPCCTVEYVGKNHKYETMMHVEDTQVLKSPAQEEINIVSHFPIQNFDDYLLYDLESEKELDNPLNASNPSCYDTDSDMVNTIDEFIHVGRDKWDVVVYDMEPTYDIENHFQVFPLQLSQQVNLDFDEWKQGDDTITDTFQAPRVDLVPYSPDHFRSYLEDFDEYSSEHLDSFHEEYYQPLLCSDPDRIKDFVFPKKYPCDNFLQPPLITLPCCVIKDVVIP
jgi:hypothetical protein